MHELDPQRRDRWSPVLLVVVGVVACIVIAVLATHPPDLLLGSTIPDATEGADRRLKALPSAFGLSGEVRLQLRMPGERFEFPLEVGAAPDALRYHWLRATDSLPLTLVTAMSLGSTVTAPDRAGFYRLEVFAPDRRVIVDSVVVGVLLPFSAKRGSSMNGYRIGNYNWERERGDATAPPPGFVEVTPETAEMAVSTHLRLSDFITHDGQESWPRYVALDPRILDKVELVLRYLGSRDHDMRVSVHSGFRTPLHNRRVPRAANDSRHQYGDAADLAIDVDGDGRVTYLDVLAVARAVERVERDHPELAGGLGLYGNRGTAPYVHIDVRGQIKRWRG
jgi:uncharacterized protein YcbK (DUF882 family)